MCGGGFWGFFIKESRLFFKYFYLIVWVIIVDKFICLCNMFNIDILVKCFFCYFLKFVLFNFFNNIVFKGVFIIWFNCNVFDFVLFLFGVIFFIYLLINLVKVILGIGEYFFVLIWFLINKVYFVVFILVEKVVDLWIFFFVIFIF